MALNFIFPSQKITGLSTGLSTLYPQIYSTNLFQTVSNNATSELNLSLEILSSTPDTDQEALESALSQGSLVLCSKASVNNILSTSLSYVNQTKLSTSYVDRLRSGVQPAVDESAIAPSLVFLRSKTVHGNVVDDVKIDILEDYVTLSQLALQEVITSNTNALSGSVSPISVQIKLVYGTRTVAGQNNIRWSLDKPSSPDTTCVVVNVPVFSIKVSSDSCLTIKNGLLTIDDAALRKKIQNIQQHKITAGDLEHVISVGNASYKFTEDGIVRLYDGNVQVARFS